jgi:hypothetical protein
MTNDPSSILFIFAAYEISIEQNRRTMSTMQEEQTRISSGKNHRFTLLK